MRLPKNPRQYHNSRASGLRVSDEDFHKVVWSIVNNQYKTVRKLALPDIDLRRVKLPDDSEFRVTCYMQMTLQTDKKPKFRKFCTIEVHEGNYRPLD